LVPFVSVAVRAAVVVIRFIRVVVSPWTLLKSPPPAKFAAKSVIPNGNTMDVDPVARPSANGVRLIVSPVTKKGEKFCPELLTKPRRACRMVSGRNSDDG